MCKEYGSCTVGSTFSRNRAVLLIIYSCLDSSQLQITDSIRISKSARMGIHMRRHMRWQSVCLPGGSPLTGGLAVCAAKLGPGNLHLINGPRTTSSTAPVFTVLAIQRRGSPLVEDSGSAIS